jgi:AcrR family transcriptional regulator
MTASRGDVSAPYEVYVTHAIQNLSVSDRLAYGTNMAGPRSKQSALRASEAICEFFVARGSTDFKVVDLAEAAGLTERTFYRYFPTKEEVVRPVLDGGSLILASVIESRVDLSVAEAVVEGFDAAVGGEFETRTDGLFTLLFRDDSLRPILLQAFHDSEQIIRPALARRLGVGPSSLAAQVAAASTLAMIRVALELLTRGGEDPVLALRSALKELSTSPFLGALSALSTPYLGVSP